MADRPLTIWDFPVVESDEMRDNEIKLVVGRGTIRQDGTLEWDAVLGVYTIKNIGEPYDG